MVRHLVVVLILCGLAAGCIPKKAKVEDPCATAPTSCWGRVGVMPADVSSCSRLASCADWEMRAK